MDRDNSKELLYYLERMQERFERDLTNAEKIYEHASENVDAIRWIRTEMLDLVNINDDDKVEEAKCSVYYILNEDKDLVKIGISNNVKKRIENMQTSTGYYLELLNEIVFPKRAEALEAESFLHNEYSTYRRTPHKIFKTSEWFSAKIVNDLMERFNTQEQIRRAIKEDREYKREIMEKIKIC